MKKQLAALLCGTMLLTAALSGCTMNSPVEGKAETTTAAKTTNAETSGANGMESEGTKAVSEKAKIGLLAPTLQTEFFINIDDGLKKECEARGWDYVAVSFDNDSATAVTSIENMVTGKCDVIVAMVSDESCDDALRKAQEAGVKIIECGVQTEVFDVCLNTDQYTIGKEIGTMAGEWINSTLDGKGKVVVYTTFQNTDMQNRGNGIQDGLKAAAPMQRFWRLLTSEKTWLALAPRRRRPCFRNIRNSTVSLPMATRRRWSPRRLPKQQVRAGTTSVFSPVMEQIRR